MVAQSPSLCVAPSCSKSKPVIPTTSSLSSSCPWPVPQISLHTQKIHLPCLIWGPCPPQPRFCHDSFRWPQPVAFLFPGTCHALSHLCAIACPLPPSEMCFIFHMKGTFTTRWYLAWFLGPAASAWPRSLLEMKNVGPTQIY